MTLLDAHEKDRARHEAQALLAAAADAIAYGLSGDALLEKLYLSVLAEKPDIRHSAATIASLVVEAARMLLASEKHSEGTEDDAESQTDL